MNRQRGNSFNFNQPILSKYDYISGPIQHFSSRYSVQKSKISDQVRRSTHVHSKMEAQLRSNHNKNRCCNCGIFEDVQSKHEYFYEEKCNIYCCHPCILIFYKKYYSMMKDFQLQFGKAPQMQVELRCGCEIQARIILKYVKKYCFDCSVILKGRQLFLKNQCLIMHKCYLSIKLESQRPIIYKEKNDRVRNIWKEISQLIVVCQNCKDLIDGQNIGGLIGQIYLCEFCMKIQKQAQQISSKSKQQKQYNYKSLELKRQDRQNNKPMRLSFFEQKQPLKSKIGHVKLSQQIQKQQMCRNCFKTNESRRSFRSIQRSSEKQTIIQAQNRKKVMQQFQNQHARKRKIQNLNIKDKKEDSSLDFSHIRHIQQKQQKQQWDLHQSQELRFSPSVYKRYAKKNAPRQNIQMLQCLSCKRSFQPSLMQMGKMKKCDYCVIEQVQKLHKQNIFNLQQNNFNDFQEEERPSSRHRPNRSYRPMSQRQQKKDQFDTHQCKLCFNAQSMMINMVCSHVLMCQTCYIKCKIKNGSNIIQCPLCKTLGDYCQYVTPIYS